MFLQVPSISQNDYKKFALQQFKEIGFKNEKEALENGFSYDVRGNVIYSFKSLETGLPVLNSEPTNKDAFKRSLKNKMGTVEPIYTPVISKRLHPSIIDYHTVRGEKVGKYKFPAGYNIVYWSNSIIAAYNEASKGIRIVIQEGAKKAASMSLNGFYALAPNGINNYRLTKELKDLIKKCYVSRIDICYDADFFELSSSGEVTDKRPRNFYKSCLSFANKFFEFIRDENLDCSLYFCAIKDNHDAKGIDDLFYKYRLLGRENEVIEAFEEGKTNDFFIFKKLVKSKAKKRLSKLIGLTSHRTFYDAHQKAIEENKGKFVFNGAKYQRHKDGRFILIELPKVGIDKTIIKVNKYLSSNAKDSRLTKAEKAIFELIKTNQKLSVAAPTGCGKTTALLNLIQTVIDKLGLKVIFCAPTQLLTKSIFKDAKAKYKSDVAILTGEYKTANHNDKNIIVCTYDQLSKIDDLDERLLIVDESHNLVSAFTYRKTALQFIQLAFSIAAKTVLLSGTPNDLMSKIFNFKAVQIKQKKAQQVKVFSYETETKDIVFQLSKILNYGSRLKNDCFDLVLFNNKEELEAIKAVFSDRYDLTNDEIVIISSDVKGEVNTTSKAVYDSIANKKLIPSGVKLILTTCIMAEGISIENTNVGKLVTISTHRSKLDIETIKQFSARLRKLDKLDLHCIVPNETALNKQFLSCPERTATTEIKHVELKLSNLKADFEDQEKKYGYNYNYDEKFLSHIDKNTLLKYIFETNYGQFHIDKLFILSDIQQEKNKTRNNVALFSELELFENITIASDKEKAELSEKGLSEAENIILKSEIEEKQQDIREHKKEALELAKSWLLDSEIESVFIESLYHSKNATNRQLTEYLEAFYFELKPSFASLEVKQFIDDNRALFDTNYFNEIVKAFVFLRLFINDENFIIDTILNYKKSHFRKLQKRIVFLFRHSVYMSNRNELSNLQKAEMKAIAKLDFSLKKVVSSDSVFYSSPLRSYSKKINQKSIFNIGGKNTHSLSRSQIIDSLGLLYDFKAVRMASTDYVYKEFKDLTNENIEIQKMLKNNENLHKMLIFSNM